MKNDSVTAWARAGTGGVEQGQCRLEEQALLHDFKLWKQNALALTLLVADLFGDEAA